MSRNYRRIPRAVIPGEEELGPQKQCAICGDWYPPDPEFFSWVRPGRLNSYCRACDYERRRRYPGRLRRRVA